MSRGRKSGLTAVAVVVAAVLGFAVVKSLHDPGAVRVTEAGASDEAASSCQTDGSEESGAGDAAFRDPVGDARAGHGDIEGVSVSASGGVLTVTSSVRSLAATDSVVALLDTNCDGQDDYVLRFWNDGSTFLSQLSELGIPITDLAATTDRRGSAYTTRFASTEVGRATVFRFRTKVDTEAYDTRSDTAPDDPSRSWSFGVARG